MTQVFKHKLIFRTAKADAMSIVGSGNATVVSELEDHSFRYSNGLDSLSFRPYLHKGLHRARPSRPGSQRICFGL